jgi:hypothetical protein
VTLAKESPTPTQSSTKKIYEKDIPERVDMNSWSQMVGGLNPLLPVGVNTTFGRN